MSLPLSTVIIYLIARCFKLLTLLFYYLVISSLSPVLTLHRAQIILRLVSENFFLVANHDWRRKVMKTSSIHSTIASKPSRSSLLVHVHAYYQGRSCLLDVIRLSLFCLWGARFELSASNAGWMNEYTGFSDVLLSKLFGVHCWMLSKQY